MHNRICFFIIFLDHAKSSIKSKKWEIIACDKSHKLIGLLFKIGLKTKKLPQNEAVFCFYIK